MRVNSVYKSQVEDYALQGMHRVLWLNDKLDLLVTIALPDIVAEPTLTYFKGPKNRSIAGIECAVEQGILVPYQPAPPPLACLTDEALKERYAGTKKRPCPPLTSRDRYVTALAHILGNLSDDRRSFFEDDILSGLIDKACAASGLGQNQIRNALNRYLALGVGNQGFLPFRNACGAPGKERSQESRLGRKSLAHSCGLTSSSGIELPDSVKKNLAWGWKAFMDGNHSIDDAYILTMGVFWSNTAHLVHGESLPELLPPQERPTKAQFERWGPKALANKKAYLTVLGHLEWEKNYRPLLGTSLDGITAVGQTAVCDATSTDVHYVSMTSRLKPIGYGNRLVIHESFSDIISGFHIGLDAPSERIALMAVLDAATSSVEFFARYGVEIEEDDVPAIFFAKYLVDNGEFRTKKTMATVSKLGSSIEMAPVGRAERKGRSEAGHRSLHKMADHKIAGTTKGRMTQRGEDKPALLACWRFHEHMSLQLKAIKYFNCEDRVEAFMATHPYRAAMLRDGVPPIRKAIYQWGVRNGMIACPPFHEDMLRAALLPTRKAVVQATGVYLLRTDRGRKKELIQGHRFLGPRATQLEWLENARRLGTFTITVHVNDNDLTRIWYPDETGMHEFKNYSNDKLLVEKGTMADSLAMQDQNCIDRELARGSQEQAQSDLAAARAAANAAAKKAKQDEIAGLEKKPTKAELTRNIGENRAAEMEAMAGLDSGVPENVGADSHGGSATASDPVDSRIDDTAEEEDGMDAILAGHRG